MITEITNDNYTTQEKLQILADAAKYDVACTSSGSSRRGKKGELGNAEACGICHSFAADGRCISLLKILMTNHCAYDCKYCINRASNDVRRATFTPQEICELTVEFYKRNYIEGLFLSSGVLKNPTYTMEKMCETLLLLRTRYHFNGYIHVKTIPGASDELLAAAGYLADRISVNLELPTETALRSLAPNKTMQNILNPMGKVQSTIASHRIAAGKSAYMDRSRGNQFLRNGIFSDDSKKTFREKLNMQNTDAKPGNNPPLKKEDPNLISRDKNKFTKHILTWENARQLAPLDMSDLKRNFAPAGQSTQMIIGATGESDYTLLQTSQALYQGFDLKRVFYSAYIPLMMTPFSLRLELHLHFCGNIACIRQTGCYASMASRQMNCYPNLSPTSMNCWIPNATGRCAIWNTFQWKLKKHLMPRCFGFPESGQNPPAGSLMPDNMAV